MMSVNLSLASRPVKPPCSMEFVPSVEFESALKVLHRFVVVATERVVVSCGKEKVILVFKRKWDQRKWTKKRRRNRERER